ncbi:hypothetical protein [Polaribacter atrinae]|uniref:hypothetical protein n=1 Tax=Polaribacter atrinae TaxID=1333662 RepID=UPI0024922CDD|nr:hypothetical protein [Polaribacter atrinae]
MALLMFLNLYMTSVNDKLESKIEGLKSKFPYLILKKVQDNKSNDVYERFVNWVAGEFDLYLMNESENLKVYFPNGEFRISNFNNKVNKRFIEIKVEGRSEKICQNMMMRLEMLLNHVLNYEYNKIS